MYILNADLYPVTFEVYMLTIHLKKGINSYDVILMQTSVFFRVVDFIFFRVFSCKFFCKGSKSLIHRELYWKQEIVSGNTCEINL